MRGSITPERAWWDVLKYDISVEPNYADKTISGVSKIQFKVLKEGNLMQIDLQEPLAIDSIHIFNFETKNGQTIASWKRVRDFKREGNVYFVTTVKYIAGTVNYIYLYYHGKPQEAINPPWDGGWIWKKDEKGRPWMSVACQGIGASIWYPCKDIQSDEPDNGALLSITVPDTLTAVGNGRLINKKANNNGNYVMDMGSKKIRSITITLFLISVNTLPGMMNITVKKENSILITGYWITTWKKQRNNLAAM